MHCLFKCMFSYLKIGNGMKREKRVCVGVCRVFTNS